MKRIGAFLRSLAASVGFLGFMLTYGGLLNETDGFFTTKSWFSVGILVLTIGLTGAVSLLTYWRMSQAVILFNLACSLFIVDYAHWDKSISAPLPVDYHKNMSQEMLAISVGIVCALVFAFFVYRILVLPLKKLTPDKSASDLLPPAAKRIPLNIIMPFFAAFSGSFLVGAVTPALSTFAPYQIIVFLMSFLIALLIITHFRSTQPLEVIVGFFIGSVVLHGLIDSLSQFSAVGLFITTGYPLSFCGALTGGAVCAYWISQLTRSSK
ncbi:hypothetical protein ACFL27_06815 [candidate division CSSED10-310 bacterium]|uniref:Uncharacterized protein n=1 Tax=candidate division CSSED10-310 bacterium TaxID=2855610 RepID=A0ABV6YUM4_UNCC1